MWQPEFAPRVKKGTRYWMNADTDAKRHQYDAKN